MIETRKCPKCSGTMTIGYLSNAPGWTEGKSMWSMPKAKAYAYACQSCGYIEFYLEQQPTYTKEQIMLSDKSGRNRLVRD